MCISKRKSQFNDELLNFNQNRQKHANLHQYVLSSSINDQIKLTRWSRTSRDQGRGSRCSRTDAWVLVCMRQVYKFIDYGFFPAEFVCKFFLQ